jgi:hypothetical protein
MSTTSVPRPRMGLARLLPPPVDPGALPLSGSEVMRGSQKSGPTRARGISARVAFTSDAGRSTIAFMKRLSGDSSVDRSIMRSAFKRLERVAASVLLVVGGAALLGWIVVELYVMAVTAD